MKIERDLKPFLQRLLIEARPSEITRQFVPPGTGHLARQLRPVESETFAEQLTRSEQFLANMNAALEASGLAGSAEFVSMVSWLSRHDYLVAAASLEERMREFSERVAPMSYAKKLQAVTYLANLHEHLHELASGRNHALEFTSMLTTREDDQGETDHESEMTSAWSTERILAIRLDRLYALSQRRREEVRSVLRAAGIDPNTITLPDGTMRFSPGMMSMIVHALKGDRITKQDLLEELSMETGIPTRTLRDRFDKIIRLLEITYTEFSQEYRPFLLGLIRGVDQPHLRRRLGGKPISRTQHPIRMLIQDAHEFHRELHQAIDQIYDPGARRNCLRLLAELSQVELFSLGDKSLANLQALSGSEDLDSHGRLSDFRSYQQEVAFMREFAAGMAVVMEHVLSLESHG